MSEPQMTAAERAAGGANSRLGRVERGLGGDRQVCGGVRCGAGPPEQGALVSAAAGSVGWLRPGRVERGGSSGFAGRKTGPESRKIPSLEGQFLDLTRRDWQPN